MDPVQAVCVHAWTDTEIDDHCAMCGVGRSDVGEDE